MVKYNVLKGFYETERTIGCGGFAKVKLATHLATGEKVAIKIMDKQTLGDDLHRVTLELAALKSIKHENICQLYQVIETETHYFIVMEYCSGGELFDHIVEKNRLSESESRVFFRQITSAVAYLHSLGYAHRDLKPENILLDRHQHLKLIDFGLCAKPEGGMHKPLFTSCGSPTYAAPELILGQQYLGQEVDIWAMGVLLYALLVGSLPFDDANVNNLYKKILNGHYYEPPFLSKESKHLIRSMLQIDPEKRIKISELLDHYWLTFGVFSPVNYKTKSTNELDRECVQAMGKFMNVDEEFVNKELSKWLYDYNTATYLLLLSKKMRGRSLKLYPANAYAWKFLKNEPLLELPINHENPSHKSRITRRLLRSPGYLSPVAKPIVEASSSPSGQFLEPRKVLKRPRSPLSQEASPVPIKKPTLGQDTPTKTPKTNSRSISNGGTPGSASRMLGSIERSLHRVRYVLTPKKNLDSVASNSPRLLKSKDLFNVSTTQCKDPELVITKLSRGLEKKGIICVRKGFTLKGTLEPAVFQRFGVCSFELEICYLPILSLPQQLKQLNATYTIPINLNDNTVEDNEQKFVGIRRKRLKGDTWCYKKVCEQVLSLTCTGFNNNLNDLKEPVLESSV